MVGNDLLGDHSELDVLVLRIAAQHLEGAVSGSPKDLLVVPNSRHTLEALEDAAVLLTVVKRR